MMKCPFQEVCSMTLHWKMEREKTVKEICDTEKHKDCVHYGWFYTNPMWVKTVRGKKVIE